MFISTALQGFNSNHFTQIRDNARYPTFSQVQAFTQAGSVTRVVLPDYVNMIRVYAWGGGGGGGDRGPAPSFPSYLTPNTAVFGVYGIRQGGNGGDGGFVQADVPIPPGTVIYVRVGEGGIGDQPATIRTIVNTNVPASVAGSGGGYSSIELPTQYPTPTRYLVLAAGGGGGGPAPSTIDNPQYGNPSSIPYYPGGDGGPAFAAGTTGTGSTTNAGSGASLIAGGAGSAFPGPAIPQPGVNGGLQPNSAGTIYGANGDFLQAGGNTTPTYATSIAKWGGASAGQIPITRTLRPAPGPPGVAPPPASAFRVWPGASGGAGWYGGGAGLWSGGLFSYYGTAGNAGGGGGSSYFSPAASNVSMANTSGGYNSHPLITTYNPVVADANTGCDVLSIGIGGVPYPWSAPAVVPLYGAHTNPNPFPWLPGDGAYGRNGGQGLVVIVY